MRVLCLGDTHGSRAFETIAEENADCDVALNVGDFVNREEGDYSMPRPTYAIFGNHDAVSPKEGAPQSFKTAEELLERSNNITHVKDGNVYIEQGLRIAGLNGNYSPKNFNDSKRDSTKPRHFTEKAHQKCLDLRHSPRLDFFLSHEAPLGCADLDWRTGEEHYGIDVIRELLDALKPRFFLSGHIHNQQVELYEETWVVNVGYGMEKEFVIIDLNAEKIELYKKGHRRLGTIDLSGPEKIVTEQHRS